jgi:phosphoglycolate phosphatase-like HAD superfamily hydrolase
VTKDNVAELLKHLGLSNRFKLVVGNDGDPTKKLDPATFPTHVTVKKAPRPDESKFD